MTAASDLEILRPDDWHLHLRDGAMLRAVLGFTADPDVFRAGIEDLKATAPKPSESMLLERTTREQLNSGGALSSKQPVVRSYSEVLSRDTVNSLTSSPPVTHVYNPLDYASAALIIRQS